MSIPRKEIDLLKENAETLHALEITRNSMVEFYERSARLSLENAKLQQVNNQLAWIIISQTNAITGRFKEYNA